VRSNPDKTFKSKSKNTIKPKISRDLSRKTLKPTVGHENCG